MKRPLRPPALRAGDSIAVVAPASAAKPERIARGAERLAALGYDVRVSPQALRRRGRYAGDDRTRAAALVRALLDPGIRGIVFARGGFGAARILPLIERPLARAKPKVVVGYSDATSLLNHLSGKLGWVTFHGPMVASDFPRIRPGDARAFAAAVGGGAIAPVRAPLVLRPGAASGRLLGGCLSIIVSALGTPYDVNFAGSILFLEDVNEEPYHIDRMLTQLRLAGILGSVRGVAFGEMSGCGTRTELLGVLRERTADLGVPVVYGVPSGHGRGKRTLPFGIRVELDTRRRRLAFLEAATR